MSQPANSYYYPLFEHMSREHGLTLLEDDMNQIVRIVEKMRPIPPLLFDGYTVLQALAPEAKKRTSAENVADTLDAVVKLLRKDLNEAAN